MGKKSDDIIKEAETLRNKLHEAIIITGTRPGEVDRANLIITMCDCVVLINRFLNENYFYLK